MLDALQKIRDMGGLELVMPAAFAATGACDDALFEEEQSLISH